MAQVINAQKNAPGYLYGKDREWDLMQELSKYTMEAYRGLIDAPGFWEWYMQKTPIEHIENFLLPPDLFPDAQAVGLHSKTLELYHGSLLGPKSVIMYQAGTELIWFKKAIGNNPDVDIVKRWFREWTFFHTVLNNSQRS